MSRNGAVLIVAIAINFAAIPLGAQFDGPTVRGFTWGASIAEVSENRNVALVDDELGVTDKLTESDLIGLVPVSVEYNFYKDALYEIQIETSIKGDPDALERVFWDWKDMLVEKYGPFASESRRPETGPIYFHICEWMQSAHVPEMDLCRNVLNGQTIVVRIRYIDPDLYFGVQRLIEREIAEENREKY